MEDSLRQALASKDYSRIINITITDPVRYISLINDESILYQILYLMNQSTIPTNDKFRLYHYILNTVSPNTDKLRKLLNYTPHLSLFSYILSQIKLLLNPREWSNLLFQWISLSTSDYNQYGDRIQYILDNFTLPPIDIISLINSISRTENLSLLRLLLPKLNKYTTAASILERYLPLIKSKPIANSVLLELLLRIYVPQYPNYDPVLARNLVSQYPKLNILDAFTLDSPALESIDEAIDYLYRNKLPEEEYRPGGGAYLKVRSKFMGNESLKIEFMDRLQGSTLDQIWKVIDILGKYYDFGLTEDQESYTIEELRKGIESIVNELSLSELMEVLSV